MNSTRAQVLFENSATDKCFGIFLALFVLVLFNQIGTVLSKKRNFNFPPGPVGLPIVGYLPFLRNDIHLKFMELGKKYGEVFSIRMGSETVVILNGVDAIREAYHKAEFLGRPPRSAFTILGKKSPFFVSGISIWKEQRRFLIKSLKDLGMGKASMVLQFQDEISCFLEALKSHDGKPMDLKTFLTPSVSNNIGSVVFGKRYEYNDPERRVLDRNIQLTSQVIAQASTHIFLPWLRHIPGVLRWLNIEKGVRAYRSTEAIFRRQILDHLETLDPLNVRDFIDSYLVEMKSKRDKNLGTTLSEETLIASVTDLFGAGSETVRTTLLWSVYVMALYPDVQKKVQLEILDVLGPDRVSELDLKEMPYTQAVVMEIMRWKTTVALNILRYTTADTTVGGYEIPKGTTILTNLWAVHHDPKLWRNPDSFEPERFLSTDGKSVLRSQNFMPYAIGKRACPAESMANKEIFLYFISMLQKFNIEFPENVSQTFDTENAITYRLKTFLVRFIPKS